MDSIELDQRRARLASMPLTKRQSKPLGRAASDPDFVRIGGGDRVSDLVVGSPRAVDPAGHADKPVARQP